MRPSGNWYHSLSKSKRNFDTTYREYPSVLWSVRKLRPYLARTSYNIRTEQHSLGWILNLSDASTQLQLLPLRISLLEFDIVHRQGIKHQASKDASRMPTTALHTPLLEQERLSIFAVIPLYDPLSSTDPQPLFFDDDV